MGDGSRLMPEDVVEIELGAQRCFEMDQDEPAWNAEVQTPLFKKVLRKPYSNKRPLVDFGIWYASPCFFLSKPH